MCKQAYNIKYNFVSGTEYISAELPAEIAQLIMRSDLDEDNYLSRTCVRGWHYSLDQGDAIETATLYKLLTPAEELERDREAEWQREDAMHQAAMAALATLPRKQAKRVYAFVYLQLTQHEIARQEGVSQPAVHKSITKGLEKLAPLLEPLLKSRRGLSQSQGI